MKKRPNRKPKSATLKYFFDAIFVSALVFLIALLIIIGPQLVFQSQMQKKDNVISVCLDWDDLISAARREKLRYDDIFSTLRSLPVGMVSAPFALSLSDERRLRKAGFSILWRDENPRIGNLYALLDRIKPRDALASSNEFAIGYPRQLADVKDQLKARQGFLPVFEFQRPKGMTYFGRDESLSFVKAHGVLAEERLRESSSGFLARIIRAANERRVRYFFIQMNPNLDFSKNIRLLGEAREELRLKKFELGPPQYFPLRPPPEQDANGIRDKETKAPLNPLIRFDSPYSVPMGQRVRAILGAHRSAAGGLALLLAVLTPLLAFIFMRTHGSLGPWILFPMVSFCTILTGLVISGLGWDPRIILGLDAFRGVKLQLLAPLLLSLAFLFPIDEWKGCFRKPVTVKVLIYVMGGGVIFFGLYLIRSGNFPMVPVTDRERHLRDLMDHLFVVRPRFKEFIIGHPLLILGLYLLWKDLRSKGQGPRFSPRIIIWVGLIGQISIINSFLHFHTPWSVSITRSVMGLLLGSLLGAMAVVFYVLVERWRHRKAGEGT